MDEKYEEILNIDDNSFIDMLDHFFLATINELGFKKELKIKKLKKEIKKLRKRNKDLTQS